MQERKSDRLSCPNHRAPLPMLVREKGGFELPLFKCNFNFIEISLKFQVQLFVSMKNLAYSRGRLPHEVKHSKRSSLCRSCFIVSTASVLLGVLSFFRAVNFCIHLCVLASSECSRMGGPGPRSSDRILWSCHLPGIIFTKRGGSPK